MVYDKEIQSGQITLSNSKLEANLAYKSSHSYIYIEKYIYRKFEDKYVSAGRFDFAIPEAMPIITLLIETSNTRQKTEYIYPSGKIKFVSNASGDSIILKKHELQKGKWYEHNNSITIHLNEMPAVISLIHRALTASTMINWQNIEPINQPQLPVMSGQEYINKILSGFKH